MFFFKRDPHRVDKHMVRRYKKLAARCHWHMNHRHGDMRIARQAYNELELIRIRANEATNKAIDAAFEKPSVSQVLQRG